MSPWMMAVLIIAVILLFVLFVPIGIGLKYENGVFALVKIAFLSFQIKPDFIKKPAKTKVSQESRQTPKDNGEDAAKKLDKSIISLDFILSLLGDFMRFTRKKISLEDFKLKIDMGTGDASSTAIATGALWAMSANLLKLLNLLVTVDRPKYEVLPNYGEACFKAEAQGIIVTRIAYIIAVAAVFMLKYLKYKK